MQLKQVSVLDSQRRRCPGRWGSPACPGCRPTLVSGALWLCSRCPTTESGPRHRRGWMRERKNEALVVFVLCNSSIKPIHLGGEEDYLRNFWTVMTTFVHQMAENYKQCGLNLKLWRSYCWCLMATSHTAGDCDPDWERIEIEAES